MEIMAKIQAKAQELSGVCHCIRIGCPVYKAREEELLEWNWGMVKQLTLMKISASADEGLFQSTLTRADYAESLEYTWMPHGSQRRIPKYTGLDVLA